MGVAASFTLPLGDFVSNIETFVDVFVTLYGIVLLAYILMSWVRLPYSPTLNRIQRFLHDVSEPYLRLFRRILPSMGPLDLSPMVGTIVLWILAGALMRILDLFQ